MQLIEVYVLVLVAFVGNGSALLCRNCVSASSSKECESMGDVQQCDATIVNANHAIHGGDNPTLVPGNGTEFKCYRIQISRMHPNGTDTDTRSYARGCTFNSTNFCSGWVSGLNVTSCGTCTTDNCDQNAVAPIPDASTTTVAPREATTVTPGVTTTIVPEATTVAPVATTKAVTTMAPRATTTVAPGATTTMEPSKATTLASSETTTLAQENTTTPTLDVTKTLTSSETTTVAPGANATDKTGRANRSAKKFTIAGTELTQIATAVYIFCNIFTIVLTLFIVFAAYTIHSRLI